jgi:mannosyltransferase
MAVAGPRRRRAGRTAFHRWALRLDDAAPLFLAVIVVGLVAASLAVATERFLWNDELFTWYFAGLPGFDDVWRELEEGAEQLPPSFYVLTRAVLDVLGSSPVALRLPEVLAFAGAGAGLFALLARRVPALYALVAVLFVLFSGARYYGSEARPYALVLLFTTTALLSWQVATEGGRLRRVGLVGLALSVAGAVCSHYFGVLVVVPLVAGELVRARQRGRVDLPVLAAMSAVLLPLVAFLPIIRAAGDFGTGFWATPAWGNVPGFYRRLLTPEWAWLPVGLILAAAGYGVWRRRVALPVPPHELVAFVALAGLPVAGVALAKLATGAFTDRYVLPAALGVAILFALAIRVVDGQGRVLVLAVVSVLLVAGTAKVVRDRHAAVEDARRQDADLRFLAAQQRPGVPLIVADPHAFFELSDRAARKGGPTLTYIADPQAAVRYLGTDTIDLGLEQLRDFAPLRVIPYERAPRRFLLWGIGAQWDWLSKRLRADGRKLLPRARHDGQTLYEVGGP